MDSVDSSEHSIIRFSCEDVDIMIGFGPCQCVLEGCVKPLLASGSCQSVCFVGNLCQVSDRLGI